MSAARRVAGGLLAVAVTIGLAALSRVPYAAVRENDGELRLAWRWRSRRVDQCRRLSDEELAKLPVHMRSAVSCERRLVPYLLEVWVDGRLAVFDSVLAKGAEADRPLSVLRHVPLAPGRYAFRVVFRPLAVVADSARPAGPDSSRHDGDDADLAERADRPLVLETSAVVAPRQVLLVTVDTDRGVLVLRTR